MSVVIAPTDLQHDFVESLCRRVRITKPALDTYCVTQWEKPYTQLDRYQVSQLIEEMKEWSHAPAGLLRAQGQIDLF